MNGTRVDHLTPAEAVELEVLLIEMARRTGTPLPLTPEPGQAERFLLVGKDGQRVEIAVVEPEEYRDDDGLPFDGDDDLTLVE